MFFSVLVYSNIIKSNALRLILLVFLASCESEYEAHSHQLLDQFLFNCSKITSATVEINRVLQGGGKESIKKLFEFSELTSPQSVLKTMCVAKVERNFKVRANRLEMYNLGKTYNAKIKLNFFDSQSIKLYFGRTTPDSFGQYVKIEKTPSFTSLYRPTIEVLIVPAYHLNAVAAEVIELKVN